MPDSFTLDDLEMVARDLVKAAGDRTVWLFYGEMGAGKTTLIKAICQELGVNSAMSSPTFSIVNQYDSNDNKHGKDIIYHFDCYRLKNEEEAYDIGVEEYLDSGHLCLIEWPEKISSLLPSSYFRINIEIDGPTKRRIHYQKV